MRHELRLAIRNWQARWRRTVGAIAAVALGTAAVVWVTGSYESMRRTITGFAADYLGNAQITISSPLGKYDQIPQRLVGRVRGVENVKSATPRLVQRVYAQPWPAELNDRTDIKPQTRPPDAVEFDLHGVDLDTEFLVRSYRLTAGRMLREDDELVCVLEDAVARAADVGVGDYLLVWPGLQDKPVELQIIGLLDRRRIAQFQKPLALLRLPVLQRITGKFALITDVDIVLADADRGSINAAARRLRPIARRMAGNATLRSVEGRMRQIEQAQAQQQFVLILLSCMAMLTALFIILSTLSMGMVERIRELGLMRCVGLTRGQLALLVVFEVLPLGVVGVLIGVPLGLLFTALTVALVPEYVGRFAVSASGVALAAAAGIVTTLLAALLPALAIVRVSPLEAAHPAARRASSRVLLLVALAAFAALLLQQFGLIEQVHRSPRFVQYAAAAIIVLYVAYALVAPLAVRIIGSSSVWIAGLLLRIRGRLLRDQVGDAVWRSAGICCGLMVGLSLIVGLFVVNESIKRGWQFPREFPEAYIWSFEQFGPVDPRIINRVPGVKECTVANSINVIVEERPLFGEDLLRSITWFLGCDPDSFLQLVKLDFVEGDPDLAIRKLKQGGHIIVADDFARSRNKHLGDQVKVWFSTALPAQHFKVAGVVRSPSLDIAATFFQLHSEYMVVASGSVMGTNEDLKRRFGIDGTRAVLLNFDLPDEPVPPAWPPPRRAPEARRLSRFYYDESVPLQDRWQHWRESQVLLEVRRRIDAPMAFYGTARELKDQIDRQLTEAIGLLAAVPFVAMLVAAIGVANLMTANVTARSRQLAILRAVGATRGLVLRLVVGEALVLGLLGGALGILLGLHLAQNITELVARMWGFRVGVHLPWGVLLGAIVLTILLCVVAGVLPARRAARTNVVDALRVT